VAQRPPAPLSPQARRQAQQQALQATLSRRDQAGFTALLAQWVHRRGVSSLQPLLLDLGSSDPEGMLWWNALQEEAAPDPIVIEQTVEEQPERQPEPAQPLPLLRVLPKVPRQPRPAPAPSHPALAQLRSWLPDQETPRAA
jgi:hypothetical protein